VTCGKGLWRFPGRSLAVSWEPSEVAARAVTWLAGVQGTALRQGPSVLIQQAELPGRTIMLRIGPGGPVQGDPGDVP
jgi:hypothetical protein